MALSGRMVNGYIPTFAVGAQLVVIDVSDRGGMLQSLSINTNGAWAKVKIEVDGVTIFNGSSQHLLNAYVYGVGSYDVAHGTTMPKSGTTSTPNPIQSTQRVFNLPFASSLKVTISNSETGALDKMYYLADYVVEIK